MLAVDAVIRAEMVQLAKMKSAVMILTRNFGAPEHIKNHWGLGMRLRNQHRHSVWILQLMFTPVL